MTKTDVLNRVTLKSTKNDVQPIASVKTLDPNSPASPRLTYALYQANRAASKINGCKVFNDWHKQGLTVKECNDLISEYNKVTGYVYQPKVKAAKQTKQSEVTNENPSTKQVKGKAGKAAQKPHLLTEPMNASKYEAQIQAIKEMRKEGLLTVSELTEALKGLQ